MQQIHDTSVGLAGHHRTIASGMNGENLERLRECLASRRLYGRLGAST
jgi:hypothetical protein